jgi:Haem-binding domain
MFKKVINYVLTILFIGMVIIQFISRPEKLSEAIDPSKDMLSVLSVSGELKSLFQTVCYDCHSNQPEYPWYSNIAPLSWWIDGHMNDGREELNFSEWSSYSKRRRDHKLEEIVEELEAKNMPLLSYRWIHWDAKLNAEQISMVKEWVNQEREKIAQED